MIRVPRTAAAILASVGLTAEDVRRIAAAHNVAEPPRRPPNRDLTGCRLVRLVKKSNKEGT